MATTGAGEESAANSDVLGTNGSCTCTTSGANSRRAAAIRGRLRGSGQMGAIEPLNGTRTGRPTIVTPRSGQLRADGARTIVSWPRSRRWAARPRTCSCTPPGESHAYGQTRAILIPSPAPRRAATTPRSARSASQSGLEHVPVGRGRRDAALEAPGQLRHRGPDAVGPAAAGLGVQGGSTVHVHPWSCV